MCIDKEAMERQKGVLVAVVKELTKNIMKGLTIDHMSLPIKIFEPRSSLHRLVDYWSFMPHYLSKAAKLTDPIERVKLVISAAVSSLYLCTS